MEARGRVVVEWALTSLGGAQAELEVLQARGCIRGVLPAGNAVVCSAQTH